MASGDTLAVFTAKHNEPPSTIAATPDERGEHPVMDFDPTADEEVQFTFVMPRNYAGGGITAYIHYSMETDITNNVVWQAAVERIGDQQQDVDASGYAAFQTSGAIAVPTTSGFVDICTVTFTNGAQMDSVAVGELFRFKVRRDADDTSATDSATTSDAELHAVELKET